MSGDKNTGEDLLDGVGESDIFDVDRLSLTPSQHQRLKNAVNSDPLTEMKQAGKRYLIVGRGSGEEGDRRRRVAEWFDSRPNAVGIRLEDLDLDGDEIDLWAPAFEILAKQATWIVGILEDFDGGHVWELGYLYHLQTEFRDILWTLKRVYTSEEKMRAKYDNGMAASHLKVLENTVQERVLEWTDGEELRRIVREVP